MPTRLLPALVLPVLLFAGWLIATLQYAPTAPLPADADPARFSAARACRHIEAFAQAPRPIGTEGNAQARAYLAGHLQALGWTVTTPPQRVIRSLRFAGGITVAAWPTNIVAVREGTGPDPGTLVLMAHYDSVATGPGASDDGAGVATILEVARALADEPTRNRLILLLTDGEEAGLIGARAFFEDHPLGPDTDLVLNFEARGSRGPVFMFETSRQNGALIDAYARFATPRVANSLTGTVYRYMPNGTDLTVALEQGHAGLNFAYIDGYFDYHTALDRPETLSLSSLQAMGAQALSLTRALANSDLPLPRSTEVAYFDFPGGFVHYPAWIGWLVLGVGVGLLALASRRVLSRAEVRGLTLLRGLGVHVGGLIALALVLQGITGALAIKRSTRLMMVWDDPLLVAIVLLLAALFAMLMAAAQGGRGRIDLAVTAVIGAVGLAIAGLWMPLLVLAVIAAGLAALLARPIEAAALWWGGAAFVALIALAAQILAPPTSWLFAWPLVFAALGLLLVPRPDPLGQYGIAAILALPAAIWLMGLNGFLFLALGLLAGGIMVVPMALLAALWTPLFQATGRAGLVTGAGLGAAALEFAGFLVFAHYSERYPRPGDLIYLVEGEQRSWATVSAPDDWDRAATGGTFEPRADSLRLFGRDLEISSTPAPRVALPGAPSLQRAPDGLTYRPGGPGRTVLLSARFEAAPGTLTLAGEPVPLDGDAAQIILQNPPESVDLQWQGGAVIRAITLLQPWPDVVADQLTQTPEPVTPAPRGFLTHGIAWDQRLPAQADASSGN